MTTLTEKRISARLNRCSEDIGKLYGKAFPDSAADAQFWEELDIVDGKLGVYLSKDTTLGAQDVERIFRAVTKKVAELVEQARMRAAESGSRAG